MQAKTNCTEFLPNLQTKTHPLSRRGFLAALGAVALPVALPLHSPPSPTTPPLTSPVDSSGSERGRRVMVLLARLAEAGQAISGLRGAVSHALVRSGAEVDAYELMRLDQEALLVTERLAVMMQADAWGEELGSLV